MKEITTKDLMPGDIILCTPNILKVDGWIGQAIVMLTGGLASHTAIYCGKREGVLKVAHSNLRGTHYDPLDYFTKNHAGFFVRRYKSKNDLVPVLTAVENYANKENPDPYPIANLVLLGMLVLVKKFTHRTLINKIVYDFNVLVTIKLMKEINERYYSKTSMTCSQFAAQCYTDAKGDYEIEFSKLFIQFGILGKGEKVSLFELINNSNDFAVLKTIENQTNKFLQREEQIVDDFFKAMNNEEVLLLSPETVSKSELSQSGAALLLVLHKARTGCEATSIKGASKPFYKDQNYLVTPDDLLFNAINLDDVGYVGRELF